MFNVWLWHGIDHRAFTHGSRQQQQPVTACVMVNHQVNQLIYSVRCLSNFKLTKLRLIGITINWANRFLRLNRSGNKINNFSSRPNRLPSLISVMCFFLDRCVDKTLQRQIKVAKLSLAFMSVYSNYLILQREWDSEYRLLVLSRIRFLCVANRNKWIAFFSNLNGSRHESISNGGKR